MGFPALGSTQNELRWAPVSELQNSWLSRGRRGASTRALQASLWRENWCLVFRTRPSVCGLGSATEPLVASSWNANDQIKYLVTCKILRAWKRLCRVKPKNTNVLNGIKCWTIVVKFVPYSQISKIIIFSAEFCPIFVLCRKISSSSSTRKSPIY
jgi:hypothetical protein